VLRWRPRSRTPWRRIGFLRPRSWIRRLTLGILLRVAFNFLMQPIVMPLLGADPINQPYHYLQGNRAVVPMTLYAMIIGAGFGEETMFRGFMFERLGELFGSRIIAKDLIVLI